MLKLKLVTLILYISLCCAIQKQVVVYPEQDCMGKGLIFESKEADVTFYAPILSESQSYSIIGCWGFYNNTNYVDTGIGFFGCTNYRLCYKRPDPQHAKSVRYFGHADTTQDSISFYESQKFRGMEVTITRPASTYIPFTPQSLYTSGHTSWTLYSGSEYNGTATCYTPTDEYWCDWIKVLNSTLSNVQSVSKGCNRHIDYYIYGDGQREIS